MAQDLEQPQDNGRRFDRLPEHIRRRERFGGAEAAGLAEAQAVRREIDRVAARLARWIAARRSDADPHAQRAWTNLRIAGLAMVAEIERPRPNGCNAPESGVVHTDAHIGKGLDATNRADR